MQLSKSHFGMGVCTYFQNNFWKNVNLALTEGIEILYRGQWRIQKNFHTGIPGWAPKFWGQKNEIYISLHNYFLPQAMFLSFKSK